MIKGFGKRLERVIDEHYSFISFHLPSGIWMEVGMRRQEVVVVDFIPCLWRCEVSVNSAAAV